MKKTRFELEWEEFRAGIAAEVAAARRPTGTTVSAVKQRQPSRRPWGNSLGRPARSKWTR